MQHPPDRLMIFLPAPFRDSPPDVLLSVSVKHSPKQGFMYNPKSVNESAKEGKEQKILNCMVIESQDGLGWKGLLKIIQSNPPSTVRDCFQ